MEIKQQYLQKYLHDIALDQLAADYTAKNYQVTREEHFDQNHQADLVARKGDEVIVVEVKTGRMTADKRRKLTELGDYVRRKSYKFLVVIATPPKPKKIDIPNLDQLLFTYLTDHFPDSINALSAHSRIVDVTNVAADEVTVQTDGSTLVKGSAVITILLSNDDNHTSAASTEVFPFTFDITIKHTNDKELVLTTAQSIAIDTSDFYE